MILSRDIKIKSHFEDSIILEEGTNLLPNGGIVEQIGFIYNTNLGTLVPDRRS